MSVSLGGQNAFFKFNINQALTEASTMNDLLQVYVTNSVENGFKLTNNDETQDPLNQRFAHKLKG